MDKFARINQLGEERVAHVRRALIEGLPVEQIAEVIQKSWGEMLDTSPKSLAQYLRRYERDMRGTPPTTEVVPAAAPKEIDTVAELVELVMIQKRRVEAALALEVKLQSPPTEQTNKAIAAMQETLLDLQKAQAEAAKIKRQLDPEAVAAAVKRALKMTGELLGDEE